VPYTIDFRPSAHKAIDKLSTSIYNRIQPRIDALAENPRPAGSVKLSGTGNMYRIRAGDYRIVYEIHDDRRIVIVLIVARRRDVYRGL
jgi:mRNA interferase RelE/StbE